MKTTTTKPNFGCPETGTHFSALAPNILVNLLTLTALLRFVLKVPDDIAFGCILPATGLMLCLSTIYYAWLAYRLAKQTGRADVCALPSGISVPHMFVVTFVIMLPIALPRVIRSKAGKPGSPGYLSRAVVSWWVAFQARGFQRSPRRSRRCAHSQLFILPLFQWLPRSKCSPRR